MPIQFRCDNCDQMLSITRRKAGRVVTCPACKSKTQVPTLEQAFVAGELVEAPAVEEPAGQAASETPPAPPDAPVSQPESGWLREEVPPDRYEFDPEPASVTSPEEFTDAEDADDEQEGFHLTRRGGAEDELDMTPMVDVTFLLLIFFMITASFSLQKSMESEAPEPEQEGASQLPTLEDFADDSVIVEIDENDAMFVDDEPVAGLGELEDVLLQKINGEQKTEMVIEPHYQATHGLVVQVTDAGMQVGMQRIRRVTRGSEE